MARREINWTRIAFLQKDSIIRYWNNRNRSVEYSLKLSKSIDEKLIHIAYCPEIGKISTFPNTRVITMRNYSIFYKFDDNQILVTSLWDNRQNPSYLFKDIIV
jgi:hypothetical protein